MMRFSLILMVVMAGMAQEAAKPPALVPLEKLNIPKSEESAKDADQPQAGSLNGNALFGFKDTEGRIAPAIAALARNPNDPNLYLAAGRMQDSLLRFNESIGMYTEAIEKFPADYRFLRYRGHRYLSVRKFREGVADLEKAVKMVPNSFDASYYLGLAYYFSGEHAKAAAEFGRCEDQIKKPLAIKKDLLGGRSCEAMKDDVNSMVPLQYWRFLALRRSGDMAGAKKYLDEEVNAKLTVTSSVPFYDSLLFFKGVKEVNEMMVGANEGTRDFLLRSSGVATYLFTEGERAKACGIWARNAMDQNWDHLGVLNSESEYWQNSRAACSLYGAAPKPQ